MTYTIQINKIDGKAPESRLSAPRIIEGCEEMSSLYRYEVLIRDTPSAATNASKADDREGKMRGYLDKRVVLSVSSSDTDNTNGTSAQEIQRIVGVVMSIESTTEATSVYEDAAWYKWTIRRDEKQGEGAYPLEELFKRIGTNWDTEVELTEKAKQRIAQDAQVQWVQNDESDYDFMS